MITYAYVPGPTVPSLPCFVVLARRNSYVVVYDLLTKNLDKIKAPRSSDGSRMVA
jgi:hypothetical protein